MSKQTEGKNSGCYEFKSADLEYNTLAKCWVAVGCSGPQTMICAWWAHITKLHTQLYSCTHKQTTHTHRALVGPIPCNLPNDGLSSPTGRRCSDALIYTQNANILWSSSPHQPIQPHSSSSGGGTLWLRGWGKPFNIPFHFWPFTFEPWTATVVSFKFGSIPRGTIQKIKFRKNVVLFQ